MTEAVLGVLVLAAVLALAWRSNEDRKERAHLVHLLVARTPAEAAYLDRSLRPAPPPKQEERDDRPPPDFVEVGSEPLGV